jgi:putative SOS response-associated peptidase YedK
MCGRYELHSHPAAIALAFGLAAPPDIAARYNIAPLTDVPVVRVNADGQRELCHLRWGLVPRRAKDPSVGSRMINARAETLPVRQAFRIAFRRHRCLLPADGFFEWQAIGSGGRARRQPLRVALKSGAPLALGGLYERWISPDGEVLDTCTIVTTPANALLAPAHERMPLIIDPADYARWLDPANKDASDLLKPYPAERMHAYPVSMRVNSAAHDGPDLLEPVEMPADLEDQAADEPRVPEQESLF